MVDTLLPRGSGHLGSFNPPRDAEPSNGDDKQGAEQPESEVPTVLTKLQKWVSLVHHYVKPRMCTSHLFAVLPP